MHEILFYPVLSVDSPSNNLWVQHAAQDIQSVFCSSGCPLGSYEGSTHGTYFGHKGGRKNKKFDCSQLNYKFKYVPLALQFFEGPM